MNVLIKSAKIIDNNSAFNNKVVDVLIEKGIIKKIATKIPNPDKIKEVKKDNLHVSRGWIDLRTNFCDPGNEHKEDLKSGIEAAIAGGFTAIVLMPDTNPVVDSKSGIEYVINRTKGGLVNVYPTGSLSANCEGKEISEMYDMHTAGAVAFTDNKSSIDNPSLLNRAMLYVKSFNGLIMSFSNNKIIFNNGQMNEGVISTKIGLKGSPALSEELAVSQAIYLAEYCDARIHLTNISTKKSLSLIKKAKAEGLKITADVNSYHLILDENELETFDSNFKVMPPLRTKKDVKALIKGVKDGTIDIICSDHTPEDIENKQCEFDNAAFGIINIQTSFSAANTALRKEIDLAVFIDKLTVNPYKLLNIESSEIKEGEKANLTFFDPDSKWTLDKKEVLSRSKNSPFIDKELTGRVYGVLNNNKLVIN